MPAPQGPSFKSQFKTLYTVPTTPEAEEYVDTLFEKISSSWQAWQGTIKVGGVTVTGGGVGAWAGAGGSGSAVAGVFALEPFVFKKQTKPQVMLTKAIGDTLSTQLSDYTSSVKTNVLNFIGSSTASLVSPGNFTAIMTPAPLVSALAGKNPAGMAQLILAKLTRPDFDISNPQAKTKELVNAIAGAIEQAFVMFWLTSTNLTANSVLGPATPGGAGTGLSLVDGTLV
jgi:hypothetical protein